MAFVYNVNNTATQVLASKQIKENIGVNKIHRNGKGITEHEETNVSTLRMLKVSPVTAGARTLGATNNGGWFDSNTASTSNVIEYDLNLLYVFDHNFDIPEVQQDMCPANIFDATTKNIGIQVATEINGSTIAEQLKAVYNRANADNTWTGNAVLLNNDNYYEALQEASTMLDDGDIDNGIQAFPFDERQIIMRPTFRKGLMSTKGVLIAGGSNYAQSMIAKGTLSPDEEKDFGTMYVGEVDATPCYIAPKAIWDRANKWAQSTTAFNDCQAIVCAASATDRGISHKDYVKMIPSPNGCGTRLQCLTRWGINVAYNKGIIPILASGTAVPSADITLLAPASQA